VTQLCVGVVSRNTVDAALHVSVHDDVPITLIASRRQVNEDGGYTGFTSRSLAEYTKYAPLITLARDHNGPFQGAGDDTGDDSFARAVACIKQDEDAGWHGMHIDPPVDNTTLALRYLRALALQVPRTMWLEIGGEEQRIDMGDASFALRALALLRENAITPRFAVVQTGTKVVEDYNVGAIMRWTPRDVHVNIRPIVRQLAPVGLKIHNGDYLDQSRLAGLADAGVAGVNIAPEYGVLETTVLLANMHNFDKRQRFIDLACMSGMWRKWMSPITQPTPQRCALLAGHYVLEHPEVREITAPFQVLVHNALVHKIRQHVEALAC